MRKLFVYAFFVLSLFSGCIKGDSNPDVCRYDACLQKAPASEIDAVRTYLNSQNITAEQHCSGMFYIIDAPGTGGTPTICDYIIAKYKGSFTNGNVFDQGQFRDPIQLNNLIAGWKNGLPLIKKGGKIRLFIPPSLGYGSQPYPNAANPVIPANSILIFEVELL
jgi:FKBP-type peptidyl-prolyl cis-trans isomerase FkpA